MSAKLEASGNQDFSQVIDRLFNVKSRAVQPSQRNETPSILQEPRPMSLEELEQARKAVKFPSSVVNDANEPVSSSRERLHLKDLRSPPRGLKKSRIKHLGANGKGKADMGINNVPVSVTVMDIHSVASLFSTIWRKHAENMNDKSIMSSLGKSSWAKVKSNLNSQDTTLRRCDLSALPPSHEKYHRSGENSAKLTLDCLASETDINKTVWQTLSAEVLRRMHQGSEENLHAELANHIGSDSVKEDTFHLFEKTLIEESNSKSSLYGNALIKMSDSIEKDEFWKSFWKLHGIDIQLKRERYL